VAGLSPGYNAEKGHLGPRGKGGRDEISATHPSLMGRNTSRTNSQIGGRSSTSSWRKPFAYFYASEDTSQGALCKAQHRCANLSRKRARARVAHDGRATNGVIRVAPVTSRVKNSATFTRVLRVKTLSESDDWKPISPKFNNVVARALIYFWLVAGNITYGASCACP